MKKYFFKSFIYIYILINIFIYIKCQENNYTKITIHKNGTIETEEIVNENNISITSIYYNESFIIYNYVNVSDLDNSYCMYYYNYSSSNNDTTQYNFVDVPSQSSCTGKKPRDKDTDNICCYYRQKSNTTGIKYGCIEINKYEIERFKWGISDILYNDYNESDIIMQIECNEKIYKTTNKYIILFIILILFINF